MRPIYKTSLSLALLPMLMAGGLSLGLLAPDAEARRGDGWRNGHRHNQCRYDDCGRRGRRGNRPFFNTYGGQVVKGGLIGAGAGAVAGTVLNRDVGRTTLLGGLVGAGVQAVRYAR